MDRSSRYFMPLRQNAEYLVFVTGVIATALFVYLQYWGVIGLVGGAMLGGLFSIIYIQSTREKSEHKLEPLDYRISLIVSSLYIILIIGLYSFVTYERSIYHYIIFGVFTSFIVYDTITSNSRRRIIPEILILLALTYWSSQFIFPAGMYHPDTKYGFVPIINNLLEFSQLDFSIPKMQRYGGVIAYVSIFAEISNLETSLSFYLLATLVLVSTALLISGLFSNGLSFSSQNVLLAALLFGIMSWTLGRGMRPDKQNFFYPLIILLMISMIRIHISNHQSSLRRWVSIAAICLLALIHGHRFSAAVAAVFMTSYIIYTVAISEFISGYSVSKRNMGVLFSISFIILLLGHPFHQDALAFRIADMLISILSSSVSSSGVGRYSTRSLTWIIFSTTGQLMLISLASFGSVLAIRKVNWEHDFLLTWSVVIVSLLVFGLSLDSKNIQPQRFYGIFGLFGINLLASLAIQEIGSWGKFSDKGISTVVISIVIGIIAIFMLISPVTSVVLSPIGEDTPHFRKYDTQQFTIGETWWEKYGDNVQGIIPPQSDITLDSARGTTTEINYSAIDSQKEFPYSEEARVSGIMTGTSKELGGRDFIFVERPNESRVDKLYNNGEYYLYRIP